MAYSAVLSDYWTKANEAAFQNRLAVSLAGKARYFLQADLSGDSADLQMAKRAFCRIVRARVTSREWLTRWGLYVLHSVGSEDVSDDADLDAVVNAVFWQLTDDALPA